MIRPVKLHPLHIQEGLESIPHGQDVQSLSMPSPFHAVDRINAEYLAEFLYEASSVFELHMHCSVNDEDGALNVMSEMLKEAEYLERVYWHGGMSPHQEEVILNCLHQGLALNESVEALHLSKFNFSAGSLRFILKNLLQSKVDLRRLTFMFCDFGTNIACLLDGIKAQNQLKYLKLCCSLSDLHLASIIQTQKSTTILALNLDSCNLQDESMKALESVLQSTETLEELHVPSQLFACKKRRSKFCRVLRNSNTTLQRLYIGRSRVNEEEVERCLQRNRMVSRVNQMLTRASIPPALLPHALSRIGRTKDAFPMFFALQKVSGLLTGTPPYSKGNRKRRRSN